MLVQENLFRQKLMLALQGAAYTARNPRAAPPRAPSSWASFPSKAAPRSAEGYRGHLRGVLDRPVRPADRRLLPRGAAGPDRRARHAPALPSSEPAPALCPRRISSWKLGEVLTRSGRSACRQTGPRVERAAKPNLQPRCAALCVSPQTSSVPDVLGTGQPAEPGGAQRRGANDQRPREVRRPETAPTAIPRADLDIQTSWSYYFLVAAVGVHRPASLGLLALPAAVGTRRGCRCQPRACS